MDKKGKTGIQRGQAITFRLPSDTPDHILKELQKLKETERRNFSSRIAQFILEGVSNAVSKERETVTIPLPKPLSKEQRNWIRHAHSEALLGSIIYQLLADPVRATSVLASLNSNALDINDALYLQESDSTNIENSERLLNQDKINRENVADETEDALIEQESDDFEDDLMNFDWKQAMEENTSSQEDDLDDEESTDDLLGGFLDRMNK
ncbi:hypothetical protein [Jeotgalibacillus soli]|uniref:Uncharacterized protein n=1 Tax=Jeotgalibacillus soli TaxID=889306 RepID=A0A0C2VK82_9BACL|nr:hypothetical protein [Jeotgalibacillus soli]KIL49322.1 hypothetical protein KP78_07900 [Jeotgalibacillus soli]